MGKITATPDEFRESFGFTMNNITANAEEAKKRTELAYRELADKNFYLCPTDKLEEEFHETYRNDLLVEFYGSMFATAIRTQLDLQMKEGKNPSAKNIAEDLLAGSLLGKVLPFADEDIEKNFTDTIVSRAMEETKEKIFRDETRRESSVKILFEQKHFCYIGSDLWNQFRPIMKEASFLSQDNLIRLVIFRETGFKLEHFENIPDLNEVIRKKLLPSKQTIFRIGLQKLLNECNDHFIGTEADEEYRMFWSADYLDGAVKKVNEVVNPKQIKGKNLIEVTKYRKNKYRNSRNK